jgi:hypothetical protein
LESERKICHSPRITESSPRNWILHLIVNTWRQRPFSEYTINLDHSMIPVVPEVELEYVRTLSGSVPLKASISTTRARRSYFVSPDLRSVTVSLPFSPRPESSGIAIPFTFANQLIPSKISISVAARISRFNVQGATFEGIYLGNEAAVRRRLVDFLVDPTDRFFFGSPNNEVIIPHTVLSNALPAIVRSPQSIVWGTTWPHELPFWESADGIDFLAQQIVDLMAGRGMPRRIALSPDDLNVDRAIRDRFLAELEVQAKLGVDVRVLEVTYLHAELGNAGEALLSLSDNIGVLYTSVANSTSMTKVIVGPEASSLRDIYHPIQLEGVTLSAYLDRYPRPASLDGYVAQRLVTLRARISEMMNSVTPGNNQSGSRKP